LNPLWVLVPDVVADKEATLKKWSIYSPIAKSFGWPLAFAVQDGMTPDDVPDECLIFVGGTTEWKWDTVPMWAATGRRVHVGRVNSIEKVILCENLGIESVDGTGWMRGTIEGRQGKDLENWLKGNETLGVVLDPFTGSGSTGKAAVLEGFNFIGIERDEKYFQIASQRIPGCSVQEEEWI